MLPDLAQGKLAEGYLRSELWEARVVPPPAGVGVNQPPNSGGGLWGEMKSSHCIDEESRLARVTQLAREDS